MRVAITCRSLIISTAGRERSELSGKTHTTHRAPRTRRAERHPRPHHAAENDRLHQEIVKALQSREVKARLEDEGVEIIGNTPEQAAAIIRADLEKWAEVIRRTGIRAD